MSTIHEFHYNFVSIGGYEVDLKQQLYLVCEYREALQAIRESGGTAIVPSRPAYYEITGIRITTPDGKTHNADWLLSFMSLDQLQEIQQDVMDSML